MSKKIVVGLSGGVDSSVAAYLLKEQGYDVIGVTLRMWRDGEPIPKSSGESAFFEITGDALFTGISEETKAAEEDARRIASALKIPFHVISATCAFHENVVENFLCEYASGRTPNPCLLCNPKVKWRALKSFMKTCGADAIATGHYANIVSLPNGRLSLAVSSFAEKDQTYALYRLTQDDLKVTMMPLGAYEKSAVRAIAEKIDLQISEKKDSEEICFIPDNDHDGFLKRFAEKNIFLPGDFVDASGRVLGRHEGIGKYTIGQRKGLQLAMGHPVYVTHILPEENRVVLGENEDLFTTRVTAKNLVFMGLGEDFPRTHPSEKLLCEGKIRYGAKRTPCSVSFVDSDTAEIEFSLPVRAVTPGQSVVLYRDNVILFGGFIE